MKTSRLLGFMALLTVLLAAGCGGKSWHTRPTVGEGNVSYGDPQAVETVAINFGSTDLQIIAEAMVNDLLTSNILTGKPTITISTIRNKTSEYIDMDNIMNTIQTRLIRSGQVQFVRSTSEMQAAVDELNRQNNSGYYNPNTTATIGRMIGARYMLEGELTSINKAMGNVGDIYYKFTLKLIDTETGVIVWMSEKDIRKTITR